MHDRLKELFGKVPIQRKNITRILNGEPKNMDCACYILPTLTEGREKCDKFFKIQTNWPEIKELDPDEM